MAAIPRFALKCAQESAGTIAVPPLCIGTWAWGDSSTWNNASPSAVADLEDAWSSLQAHKLFFLDTAEVYGKGESERIIARLRANSPAPAPAPATTTDNNNDDDGTAPAQQQQLVIASKFLPIPWPPARLLPSSGIPRFCRASLQRLGLARMDLYQIHGPVHFANSIESMARGLAACVAQGLTRAVGVSNYSVSEMVRMDDALQTHHGLRLASNQVEFSLLRTRAAQPGGLLDECRRRGIVLLAYSPLGMGRLTGKYSREHPPPAGRRFGNVPMDRLMPLLDKLREVAARHGVSCSAVALKWVMQKGAIPLGGVKNAKQADENAMAASEAWALTEEDMKELDGLALEGSTNFLWQHG